jgi:4'-phosphopantetheinyl transferase
LPGHTAAPERVVAVERGPQLAPDAWRDLVSRLPLAEAERIATLQRWQDRQDSALGWDLLTTMAARHGAGVRRGDNARPVADAPVDVSMSHAGGWVVAVAGLAGRVGVDVEPLRAVSPALARRCLSPRELAWLEEHPGDRSRRFAELWTAKEAYLKATGAGLSTDPRDVRIDPTGGRAQVLGPECARWKLTHQSPAAGVVVTLCAEVVP